MDGMDFISACRAVEKELISKGQELFIERAYEDEEMYIIYTSNAIGGIYALDSNGNVVNPYSRYMVLKEDGKVENGQSKAHGEYSSLLKEVDIPIEFMNSRRKLVKKFLYDGVIEYADGQIDAALKALWFKGNIGEIEDAKDLYLISRYFIDLAAEKCEIQSLSDVFIILGKGSLRRFLNQSAEEKLKEVSGVNKKGVFYMRADVYNDDETWCRMWGFDIGKNKQE